MDLRTHPQFDQLSAAWTQGGFAPGVQLPFHYPGCYGCGPDNPYGLGLVVHAAEGDAVTATYAFDRRFEGTPGVVHGGATAALLDDLYGSLLVRLLTLAVTVDLQVSYPRPLHVEAICELRAELVDRTDRDLRLRATVVQHGDVRVTSEARFRTIALERLSTRYERVPAAGAAASPDGGREVDDAG